MNKLLTTALVGIIAVGCASDHKALPEAAGNPDAVHLGMNKTEVLQALGGHRPNSISQTPRGEIWNYNNVALAAIPFNFGFHPEFKTYTFDTNGVLIDFNTTKPTK